MSDEDRAPPAQGPSLKHAERFTVEGDDGKPLELVLLAKAEIDGRSYALLVGEKDFGSSGDDMDVYAFRYIVDEDGDPDLDNLADDAESDKVMAHFSELMGWD